MSSSTITNELDFLLDKGKDLSKLLSDAKNKDVITSPDTFDKVKVIINHVLEAFKETPSNSSKSSKPILESVQKLLKKIIVILEDFIKNDRVNKSGYEDLAKLVGDFEYRKQASALASASAPDMPSPPPAHSANDDSSPEITNESDDLDYKLAYEKLSENDKKYVGCFLLFPAEVEIKKREIIHCWIGMNLRDNEKVPVAVDGERRLAKFVAMGLIDRTFQNKKLLNRYKMSEKVRAYLIVYQPTNPIPQAVNDGNAQESNQNDDKTKRTTTVVERELEGSWYTLRHQSGTPNNKSYGPRRLSLINRTGGVSNHADTLALLNISQTTLDPARLKTMSEMGKLKVVHLGSWRQESKKYIVVEDVEAFRELKHLSKARFLSLEGVSGMVKLPEHVYELYNLEVLDLRACNNLETLPAGIKELKKLTHLDLSGCYLLDHVPIGITELTALRVLKGFIINKKLSPEEEIDLRKLKGKRSRTTLSPCPFDALSKLHKLRKLTILTRRTDFPTKEDFNTFGELKELSCLRITWVGTSSPIDYDHHVDVEGTLFPPTLTKLELQAASNETASHVLRLISEDTGRCGLEKLYLRGGGLKELKYPFPQPTVVRLRYLPDLQIDWDDFRKLFQNLDRLEVLECPNLILFPCDENGVWEHTQSIFDDEEGDVKKGDDEKKEIHSSHEIESSTNSEIVASSSN